MITLSDHSVRNARETGEVRISIGDEVLCIYESILLGGEEPDKCVGRIIKFLYNKQHEVLASYEVLRVHPEAPLIQVGETRESRITNIFPIVGHREGWMC